MKILTNSFFINFEKSANILDQKIPWSYAGLDDLSGQNLYWSQSRVYNANIEQWMTADPLVKWQARELSARPGNYYPYRYAGNDPLMMVDVSGHWYLDGQSLTNEYMGQCHQELNNGMEANRIIKADF